MATATGQATTASRASAGAARAEAAARQQASQVNRAYTTTTGQAAGATGNLVAQFNDIGMMLMAGQNPLQLAIQQGSQITQVIGPMGAAGAAKALGGAFIGMLNPLSLITMGIIGFGAAAVQAFMGAEEQAAGIVDQLDKIRTASAETQTEIDKLRFGVDEDYQVDLLRQQITLRSDYNAKVTELNSYLATTTDSIDLQRMKTEDLRTAIATIAGEYNAITASLELQQNRSAQLSVIEGIKAQQAAELAARSQEAERAQAALLVKAQALVTTIASADGSNLTAAFGAAFPNANALLGLAQSIVSTIGQAQAFQSAETGELAAQYAQYGSGRVIGERLARESGSLYGGKSVLPAAPGAAGSGGGAAAARDEADALQELIRSLEGEVEALRVTDPIQQEMLRHREALAGATEAERQKVEDLIAAREREAALMDAAKERAEFFENMGAQAIDALIVKGESFNDVLKTIIASLIQAALQAAIFGEGPFGGMFGGKSLFSGMFGGGKAEGGMIHGPGTGTSDSILTPLSNGEYVVNAKATARNRALLEAINSGGSIGGMAQGGMVGADNRRRSGRGGSDLPASIYIDLRGSNGDQAIEERVRRGAAEVVSLYDRDGLAVSLQRVTRDPKRRG